MSSAETLAGLHVPGKPLVLPNCWDVMSAVAVAQAGFPVVATSSVGVATSLGYADHHGAPAGEMFAAAGRIAAAVDVPVTVDAEGGYDLPPREFVDRLAATGAVGCNLEDTDHRTGELVDVTAQADWLAQVRAAADAAGFRLVINARIDVFLPSHRKDREEADVLDSAGRRARAYFESGVDCVYPIVLGDKESIRRIVDEAGGRPVNTLYLPGGIDPAAAGELGVARVSFGGGLAFAADRWLRETLAGLADGKMPY
jgi:2-methylisocitrate lyase-like PEP mutase family enzyme